MRSGMPYVVVGAVTDREPFAVDRIPYAVVAAGFSLAGRSAFGVARPNDYGAQAEACGYNGSAARLPGPLTSSPR